MNVDECRVVVHYLGGRLVKGYTTDFNQDRDKFHVVVNGSEDEEQEVMVHDLKAIFFVKSLDGNPNYCCPEVSVEEVKNIPGMKLKVCFSDGECIYATTRGYSPARRGFFILPLDKYDNNSCIYVNKEATVSIDVIR